MICDTIYRLYHGYPLLEFVGSGTVLNFRGATCVINLICLQYLSWLSLFVETSFGTFGC